VEVNLGRVGLRSTNFKPAPIRKQNSYGHVMAVHSALTPLYPVHRLQDSSGCIPSRGRWMEVY